jgi:hypothetical protein
MSTDHAKSCTGAKIWGKTSVPLKACLVALALAAAGLLSAPAYSQVPPAPDTSSVVDPRGAEYPRKDPQRAVQYSVWGTVLGTPIFGPAAGHFYAGNHRQAWIGIGTRTGGALLPFLGLEAAGRLESGGLGVLLATALAGGATVLISAIHDIVTADDAVRERNQARRLRRATPAEAVPAVGQVPPTGGSFGKRQVGVALKVDL